MGQVITIGLDTAKERGEAAAEVHAVGVDGDRQNNATVGKEDLVERSVNVRHHIFSRGARSSPTRSEPLRIWPGQCSKKPVLPPIQVLIRRRFLKKLAS